MNEPSKTSNLVIAHFMDGRLVRGVTRDFSPQRPVLHITESEAAAATEVRLDQLKALFFVKTLAGDPKRQDLRGFVGAPSNTTNGRKVVVLFKDGELISGYAQAWSPERSGFFLFPADTGSNNHRIFVFTAAAKEIKTGPAAEVFVETVLAAQRLR